MQQVEFRVRKFEANKLQTVPRHSDQLLYEFVVDT